MELQILDMIQQIRSPFLDSFMTIISTLGNRGVIWILMTVILFFRPKDRKIGIMILVALLLNMLLCNALIKPLVGRVRPCDVNWAIDLLVRRPLDKSFPSGHTSAAFAVTTALLFSKYRKWGWFHFVFSLVLAFSRLYLYVHYPTDVLVGAVLGTMCGFFAYYFVEKKNISKIK